MIDVAVQSGVSIGTVSRVLSERTDVAPELAERVKRTARELGYELRQSSRQTQARRNALGSIAYLLDRTASRSLSDAFQQHFLTGIEQRANEREGHIVYTSCGDEIEQNRVPSIVTDRLVRGAIIKGEVPEAWVEKVNAVVPTVLLMSKCTSRAFPSIVCDNVAATYQIMRYLRDMGHRRIGFIYEKDLGTPVSFHHIERREAYLQYIAGLELEFLPEYIQTPVRSTPKEDLSDVMAGGIKNLLALGDKRPTALIATADAYALSVLRIAPSLGLSIPRDLSLAGYMNTDACEYASPPLTSVCLSGEEIGRASVDLLESRIAAPDAIVRHIVVAPRLIERLSCCPPRVA